MHSEAPPSTAAPSGNPPGQQSQAPPLGRRVLRAFLYQRELTPLVLTLLLFTYFTIKAGSQFTGELSLSSAAGAAGPIGGIAVGEVLLLVLAEIDLSAGQVFLFCPWVMYWLNNAGVPVALAIVLALVVVAGVGAVNGLITVGLNVPSFVTTLAMNFILFGLVLIYSNQTQGTPIPLSSSTTGHVSFASQAMGVWAWSEILWVARDRDLRARAAHAHALRRQDHRHGRESARRRRGRRARQAREGVGLRPLLGPLAASWESSTRSSTGASTRATSASTSSSTRSVPA